MATLTFHGAAQEVTGSCYLLDSPAIGKVLLDCGLKQGGEYAERLTPEPFNFDPKTVDMVILSHAHLDHSGMLPRLIHKGFKGPIYCTQSTAELIKIMIKDSAGLYESDLKRENTRRQRKGKKEIVAEYTLHDVQRVFDLCEGFPYNKSIVLKPHAHLCFYDAGHILGSSIVEIKLEEKGKSKTLVFSGDLGNSDSVLMKDPAVLTNADVVLMEGTYGDRNHRTLVDTNEELTQILSDTWAKGGNVMIPAFAVGRTQEIIFHLGCLYHEGKLDNWQIFLDSPMAIAVTQVYDRWLKLLDQDDVKCLSDNHRDSLAKFLPSLILTTTTEESMSINRIKQGAIIIAGSGMCTGGRIRQHFKHRIWNDKNTIIFIGFQARGTLGRILVEGKKNIKMFGEEFVVNANIETLGGFSAHAGQSQLISWLSNFKTNPRVMLIHGESEALDALSQKLYNDHGISSDIPAHGSCIAW